MAKKTHFCLPEHVQLDPENERRSMYLYYTFLKMAYYGYHEKKRLPKVFRSSTFVSFSPKA